jgi:hypothetical protein
MLVVLPQQQPLGVQFRQCWLLLLLLSMAVNRSASLF